MLYILLREKGLIHWYPPIYAQTLILYTDAPIRLRSIEIIAFVLENSYLTQYRESMSEPSGHEKLAMVILTQFNGYMLTISWTSFANIHGYVRTHPFTQRTNLLCVKGASENASRASLRMRTYSHYPVRNLSYEPSPRTLAARNSRRSIPERHQTPSAQ